MDVDQAQRFVQTITAESTVRNQQLQTAHAEASHIHQRLAAANAALRIVSECSIGEPVQQMQEAPMQLPTRSLQTGMPGFTGAGAAAP